MEPVVFQPKSGTGWPFLIFIAIVVGLGGFGVIRSVKMGTVQSVVLLALVLVVAVGIGVLVIRSLSRAEPITIYADHIGSKSWSIAFNQIQGVREDSVGSIQYTGGRPVVGSGRCLVVDTPAGRNVIAYEATYDIEAMRLTLEAAIKEYRKH